MKGHIRERSPGRWAIVLDVPDPATGKRRRKWHAFHGTKRQAQVECARLISELKGGVYIEPDKTTVAVFLNRWLEHVKPTVSRKTHERYTELCVKALAPLLGDVTLSKLKTERIDAALSKALTTGRHDGKGGLSPTTVRHMRRVLVMALNQAVTWELLAKNPAAVSKAPKQERKPMLAYDAPQTAMLLQAIDGKRLHIPVLLAVMCGLRRGEIAALRWKHIDWAGARVSIIESAEQTSEGVHYKEPKSGRSRVVDLSPSVVAALKAHRARQAEGLLALGIRSTDDTFIVSDHEGTPLKPRMLTDGWLRLLDRLDLPKIRFHDLRHTHATQLLSAGVHPKIASERLGHSTIGITLDLYSHVMPGMQANAAAQIDEMIRRAVGDTGEGKG
ncbi:site-specific integrase [Neorhizobium petrolearium]|uniref:Site-specific integrase n=1 Tax=Neorhizobium petrolearium TaxID=515361 RepID=A0ABY8M2R4_9HYPH|nr:site-specific integrase [Neorhizobium petrolearium]MCC2612622.1 site-specific integrase [Neorhizobium petrolearium]WGI67745.1 site-specific integrase [Neorhizobium petrolearium]